MENVIYVTGNILSESGYHVAKEWFALAGKEYKNEAIQIIEGDLVLTNNSHTIPYCMYAAAGDVACTYGNIAWLGDAELLLHRYQSNIVKLKQLAELSVPEDLIEDHLKCLNAGVFAEFESFMIELLSTLILSDKSRYEGFITRKNIDKDGNILNKVYKSIHHILGHKLKDLKEEFDALQIKLPDTSVIGRYIEYRHDVIHRSGKKVMGNHLKTLAFTKEKLFELIEDFDAYVMAVIKEVRRD